ncbi:MAG: HEPN domain-containing protein [Chloroflexi bacterium]|nr:HEPN domain-containing protein [Chloroflexota bacterium]
MPSRHEDWLRQAKRDLEQALYNVRGEYYEWACFSAQQAAEKAVKALYQKLGADAWGHSVHDLLKALPDDLRPKGQLLQRAKWLDRQYIPPRYPNSVAQGIPADYYGVDDARQAMENAEAIVRFCEGHIL